MTRKNNEAATLVGDDILPALGIGDVIKIDADAIKNRRLTVTGTRQYAGGSVRPMVDYVLEDDPGKPPVRLRLLANEYDNARSLVLTLYDSLHYSEGLHNVVRDESARLTIHDDPDPANIAGDIFWRIYDVTVSHIRNVNIRSNIGITDATVEYWDYSRLIDIEGIETEEFVFVEMNLVDGAFEVWRGVEVAPDRIAVESRLR